MKFYQLSYGIKYSYIAKLMQTSLCSTQKVITFRINTLLISFCQFKRPMPCMYCMYSHSLGLRHMYICSSWTYHMFMTKVLSFCILYAKSRTFIFLVQYILQFCNSKFLHSEKINLSKVFNVK